MTKGLLALLLLLGIGCGSGSDSPADKLQGNWMYVAADGLTGIALDFQGNGYVTGFLGLTSATSANAEIETGIFTATASSIGFTPQKYSCPGPDAVYSLDYSWSGSLLAIHAGANLYLLERNDAMANGSFVITTGCVQNGYFYPMPVAPVSN